MIEIIHKMHALIFFFLSALIGVPVLWVRGNDQSCQKLDQSHFSKMRFHHYIGKNKSAAKGNQR